MFEHWTLVSARSFLSHFFTNKKFYHPFLTASFFFLPSFLLSLSYSLFFLFSNFSSLSFSQSFTKLDHWPVQLKTKQSLSHPHLRNVHFHNNNHREGKEERREENNLQWNCLGQTMTKEERGNKRKEKLNITLRKEREREKVHFMKQNTTQP